MQNHSNHTLYAQHAEMSSSFRTLSTLCNAHFAMIYHPRSLFAVLTIFTIGGTCQRFARIGNRVDLLNRFITTEYTVAFTRIQCAALCKVHACEFWRRIPPSTCQVGVDSLLTTTFVQPSALAAILAEDSADGEGFFASLDTEYGSKIFLSLNAGSDPF